MRRVALPSASRLPFARLISSPITIASLTLRSFPGRPLRLRSPLACLEYLFWRNRTSGRGMAPFLASFLRSKLSLLLHLQPPYPVPNALHQGYDPQQPRLGQEGTSSVDFARRRNSGGELEPFLVSLPPSDLVPASILTSSLPSSLLPFAQLKLDLPPPAYFESASSTISSPLPDKPSSSSSTVPIPQPSSPSPATESGPARTSSFHIGLVPCCEREVPEEHFRGWAIQIGSGRLGKTCF